MTRPRGFSLRHEPTAADRARDRRYNRFVLVLFIALVIAVALAGWWAR